MISVSVTNEHDLKKLHEKLEASKKVEEFQNQTIKELQLHIKYLEGKLHGYEAVIKSLSR